MQGNQGMHWQGLGVVAGTVVTSSCVVVSGWGVVGGVVVSHGITSATALVQKGLHSQVQSHLFKVKKNLKSIL